MHCSHINHLKGGAIKIEKMKCDANAEKVTSERALTHGGLSGAFPDILFSHQKFIAPWHLRKAATPKVSCAENATISLFSVLTSPPKI